jgi:PAS domain S-box-containing protein
MSAVQLPSWDVLLDLWPDAALLVDDHLEPIATNRAYEALPIPRKPETWLPVAFHEWNASPSRQPFRGELAAGLVEGRYWRCTARRIDQPRRGCSLLLIQEESPQNDLELTHAKLDAAMRACTDFILFLDLDGEITYLNRSIAPSTVEDYIGGSAYEQIPAEFQPAMKRSVDSVLKGAAGSEYVTDHREKDGTVRSFRVRVRPVMVRDEIVGITLAANDISDSLRVEYAEDQQRRLREQLLQSQKLEALGTLATGVAHDFNNLTTAINGLIELAMRRLPEDNEARQTLMMARSASENARGVTRSLLTFARKVPSTKQAADLVPLVTGAMHLFRRMLPSSIDLRTEVAEDASLPIQCNEIQIQQVMLNLAVNARDAMPDGGSLTVRLRREGNEALLSFEDTGCGISEEDQARIFEPFYTTKERTAGTGLGLAVVLGILADHGGKIRLHSTLGEGTRFDVRLPLFDGPLPPVSDDSAEDPRATVTARIILVENHEYVRAVMVSTLESLGHEVFPVDGPTELCCVLERDPDIAVVLVDLDMAARLSTECLAQLASHPAEPSIVLVSTSQDQLAQCPLRHSSLVGAVLMKPFSMAELIAAVHQAIGE